MVTVSTGDTVSLGCIVVENPSARLRWVRSGVVIRNNSRNTEAESTENIKDDEDSDNDVSSTGNLISLTEVAKGRL